MSRNYSELTGRIAGRGADAWLIHAQAKDAAQRGEDVIVLSVGDPDLDTPTVIAERAIAAIRAGDTHYTPVIGRPGLRAAVAERQARLAGQRVGAEHVACCSGAQNALYFAVSCLVSPGDRVAVIEPAYVTYPATVEQTGAVIDYVTASAEAGFRLEVDALAAAIRPETRAIVLANPNNPTGVVLNRDELSAIYAIAEQHDLWIISDEVYGDLVYDGAFIPMGALEETPDRVITVGSLSKSHAMTGWRSGWTIGPPAFTDHVERLSLAMLYGMPGFVMEAAEAALREAADTPAEMTAIYHRRSRLAMQALDGAPGLDAKAPAAGMFMMIDVRGVGFTSQAFVERLYRETGVSVLDGGAFGPPTDGFVRLSFAASEATILEGCRRIRRFAETHAPAVDGGRIAS
ncbi:pyridoxal phosphate-dependent aminotransferase [Chthonobacter albigriseus]|uniref:pyridoxal phosphate-dependent aminotransferase n=1 Tax=Chthonobacter albigriseus TaxID=1683161 RepID=UPI0015EFBBAB|nr:pyridoxal phosphate-dependent aminotransferase [Chthonobacter albigriseus]